MSVGQEISKSNLQKHKAKIAFLLFRHLDMALKTSAIPDPKGWKSVEALHLKFPWPQDDK